MRRNDYIALGLTFLVCILIVVLGFKALDTKFTTSYKQLEASWAKCETKMVNAEFIVDPRIHMCFYSLSNNVSFIISCSSVISLEEFKPVRHCWKIEEK